MLSRVCILCGCFPLQRQNGVIRAETIWLTKAEIIYSLTLYETSLMAPAFLESKISLVKSKICTETLRPLRAYSKRSI